MSPPSKPLIAVACIAAFAIAIYLPSFMESLRATGRQKPLRIAYALMLSLITNYTVAGASFLVGLPIAHSENLANAFSSAFLILSLTILLDKTKPTKFYKTKKEKEDSIVQNLVQQVLKTHGTPIRVRAR